MKKLRSPLNEYSFVLNKRFLVPLPAGQSAVGQRVFLSTKAGHLSFACAPNGLVFGRYPRPEVRECLRGILGREFDAKPDERSFPSGAWQQLDHAIEIVRIYADPDIKGYGRKFDLRVCRAFGRKVLEVGPAARAKVVNREFVLAARKEKFNRVSSGSLSTVIGPDEDRQVMGEIYACVLQSAEILEGKRMYMHLVRRPPALCIWKYYADYRISWSSVHSDAWPG